MHAHRKYALPETSFEKGPCLYAGCKCTGTRYHGYAPVYPGKGGTKHTCVFSGDVKEWTGSVRSLKSTGSELDITFSGNKVVNTGVLSLLALATLATRRKRA